MLLWKVESNFHIPAGEEETGGFLFLTFEKDLLNEDFFKRKCFVLEEFYFN